jgi:ABC-type multidrug transport system fused ATPase/permease subunit
LESIRQLPRIIVLDGGSIVADGSHGALLSLGGLYTELVSHHRQAELAVD